ncbi:MAG: oxidoreductase [Deinococcus-Thermus bacterium]|nr:oxidoreductase [Deinococcota bacterium]
MTAALTRALPAAAVLLPLIAALVVAAWPRGRRLPAVLPVAATLASALAAWAFVPLWRAGVTLESYLLHVTPTVRLHLRVDGLGALYGATVAALWLLALVYAFGYLHGSEARGARFHAFLLACLACLLGVAWAGNLLSFLVFYELFSVLSYALIVHEQTRAAVAAGAKYLAYVLVGGSLVLAGVLLVHATAGTLAFTAGGTLPPDATPTTVRIAFACFAIGFGVKAALVPLHGWVPDAHPAAPAPVSALLSGVMVAAGGVGLVRVVYEVLGAARLEALGVLPWLAGVAAATVLIGGLAALAQPDLKRRLAWSTISQMGYLTLGVALGGPATVAAALAHLVHHAFLKGTLFFCAGAWIRGAGARTLHDLRGMAARTPALAAAFALASLGMMGVPPLSGFVSKWALGAGMLEVGAGWALAVLLLGALLAAGYLLPVVATLYRTDGPGGDAPAAADPPNRIRPGAALTVPTLIAAAATLVFGLAAGLPGFPLTLARQAAASLLGGG